MAEGCIAQMDETPVAQTYQMVCDSLGLLLFNSLDLRFGNRVATPIMHEVLQDGDKFCLSSTHLAWLAGPVAWRAGPEA